MITNKTHIFTGGHIMKKVIMYVGLNDKDTKQQEIQTIDVYKILTNIFVEKTGGATINENTGIYTHDNGTIVIEKTLTCIVFTDDIETVKAAAEAIKTALNQESVIIEVMESNSMFL